LINCNHQVGTVSLASSTACHTTSIHQLINTQGIQRGNLE